MTRRTVSRLSCAMAMLAMSTIVVASEASATKPAAAPVVCVPSTGEKAYKIAGEAFADLWQKVTGQRPEIRRAGDAAAKLPEGDVVLIGSDAVNPIVHALMREGAFDRLDIIYGGDDYRMLAVHRDGRRYLILAGGSGRSTLYAVYDFFHRQAGCEYFWDGDVIPHRDAIAWDGLDVRERPRFDYRGVRYFAHRGLARFQAEHWDLDDWKRELDWLTKKRLNLFMLRTGIDDLFQRAFADVPYPPTDAQDPDAVPRSYNDRTSFWPLKYRGELRKQVLQYARDRGLIHPEDVGTITHWYSHTPSSFYRSYPDFPVLRNQKIGYALATQAIWDIESDRTWDAYWKLTETHIREFGGLPQMFHTIGLAERTFGKTPRENLQCKLYAYHKIVERVREHYPNAPLLVGGWDFMLWDKEDVRRLLGELDPQRTIVLDYLADNIGGTSYRDFGLLGKFPWIFGIFHSFARNSDVHGDYGVLTPRLREAAADVQCRGLVFWPELSHSDTFLLEYLADNSWRPDRLDLTQATSHYCTTRYPAELAASMTPLWTSFLTVSQSVQWGALRNSMGGNACSEPQFRPLGVQMTELTPKRLAGLESNRRRMEPGLKQAPAVLSGLAGLADRWYDNPQWRRDALDMTRTAASRALYTAIALGAQRMDAWRSQPSRADDVRRMARLSQNLMAALGDVLAMSDDFSMDASLRRLTKAREINGVQPTVNPNAEQTLKSNTENDYCRSQQYELVQHVYRPELAAYWDWVEKRMASGDRAPWRRTAELAARQKAIVDQFYATPLAEMAPPKQPCDAKRLAEVITRVESLVKELLGEIPPEK